MPIGQEFYSLKVSSKYIQLYMQFFIFPWHGSQSYGAMSISASPQPSFLSFIGVENHSVPCATLFSSIPIPSSPPSKIIPIHTNTHTLSLSPLLHHPLYFLGFWKLTSKAKANLPKADHLQQDTHIPIYIYTYI